MLQLYVAGGPYMHLLALLAIVVLVLSVKKAVELSGEGARDRERAVRGVDAILFWGGISAVVGLLGQFSGAYLSLMIIRSAPMVDPYLVAEGIAVSLLSTIFGMAILAVAALAWFALRSRLDRLASSRVPDGRTSD